MWERLNRLIKLNGVIALFSDNPFSSKLINSNIKNYKYDWIWEKEQGKNFQHCKRMPLKKTEYINIFYNKQPLYNPQGLIKLEKPIIKSNKGKGGNLGHLSSEKKRNTYEQWYTNYPSNILKFNADRGFHPTQKPVKLLEYLIKTYTNKNELVLDFTMGSGSTGVACMNTDRKFIGIELDNNYFDIASKRIEEAFFNAQNKEGAINEEE
jgi:site-specific DNA-methyltransferase (adenine-specific)